MARIIERWLVVGLACILWYVSHSIPVSADDAGLSLLEAYPYETNLGWDRPQYEFHWPNYHGLGIVARLESSGYEGLREVRVLLTAETPTGEEVLHHVETANLPAGVFEFITDELSLGIDPFHSTVLHFTTHVSIVGVTEATSNFDASIFGAPAPQVSFDGLHFFNPSRKQNMTRLFPDDEFVLEGEVLIEANPTPMRPVLYVGCVMLNEEASLDLAQPAMVNDLNWGRIVLDAPAGAWHFTIHGRLPHAFPKAEEETQPLQFVVAVRWSPTALVTATLDGEVLNPGLGFNGSRVQSERLATLDPAWEWEITPAVGD